MLLSDPAFSFGDLPPAVGCLLPSQRFPPRSKDKDVYREGDDDQPQFPSLKIQAGKQPPRILGFYCAGNGF